MRALDRFSTSSRAVSLLRAAGTVVVLLVLVCGAGAEQKPTSAPATFGKGFGQGGPELDRLVWQMLAATLVVIVIGALAFVAVKKLLPRIRIKAGKQISVLETAYLGPRVAVHLIKVGAMKLLVGSCREGLVRLADVTGALSGEYAEVARKAAAGAEADEEADKKAAAGPEEGSDSA